MANKRSAAKTRSASGPAAAQQRCRRRRPRIPPQCPPHRERAIMKRILLVDLGERELKIRQELRARRQVLETIAATAETSGGLNPRQMAELERIKIALGSDIVADPFYQQVAATHQQKDWAELAAEHENVHEYGLLGSQRTRGNAFRMLGVGRARDRRHLRPLQIDGYTDASRKGFVQRISHAQGEYREHRALFDAAFEQLANRYLVTLKSQVDAGIIDADIIGCDRPDGAPEVRRGAFSTDTKFLPGLDEVVGALSGRNIAARGAAPRDRRRHGQRFMARQPHPERLRHADRRRGRRAAVGDGNHAAGPRRSHRRRDHQRENLNAAQAIYFAYMLEEMRLPQVVERIVELFRERPVAARPRRGRRLPVQLLQEGVPSASPRASGATCTCALSARRAAIPNGNEPNRDFNELWLRFVSAVSTFARQLSVDRLLRTNIPVAVSQEQVRKAGRDLRRICRACGYGIAYFAATELQTMILEYRDSCSATPRCAAHSARATCGRSSTRSTSNYLGGARNTHRYRTQARAGAVIIRWLANHHERLTGRFGEVISIAALTNPQLRGSDQPTVAPNDWDLVQACEQWLAVGGVQDASIEQYSQAVRVAGHHEQADRDAADARTRRAATQRGRQPAAA